MSDAVDRLLKAQEVADFLQISLPTLYRLVAAGQICKPLKLGGSSRWARSDVLAVVERARADRSGSAAA